MPPFDPALLPEALRPWIMDEAERMPCPPDFIAAPAIVMISSIVGARCGVRPKSHDSWIVVPNLWGGVVGLPSTKKSPAIGAAMKPLGRLIEIVQKIHEHELHEYATKKAIHEAKIKAMEGRLKLGETLRRRMERARIPKRWLAPCRNCAKRSHHLRSCRASRATTRPSRNSASFCGTIRAGC